uniref:Ankyrin repeat domain protein n=1 Tax=Mycena chlorophos TaxID=658473 RepID=A0ABQ0M0X9_MYCCL|nr:ankyrin repeat domain protein [Mycena chlorophos]
MATRKAYFVAFPPELILLLSTELPLGSQPPFMLACRRIRNILQPDIDRKLLSTAVDAFFWAAEQSKVVVLRRLLAAPYSIPADAHVKEPNRTPLHAAIENNATPETIECLIAAGANVSAMACIGDDFDPMYCQPLHLAVEHDHAAAIRVLVSHGASVEAVTETTPWTPSMTVLQSACGMGQVDAARALLECGAQVDFAGTLSPPLFVALKGTMYPNPRVVKLLLDHGANPNPVLTSGEPLLYLLLGLEIDPYIVNPVLRLASVSASLPTIRIDVTQTLKECMALLLEYGASREATLDFLRQEKRLKWLANKHRCTTDEMLDMVLGLLDEAEQMIPQVVRALV